MKKELNFKKILNNKFLVLSAIILLYTVILFLFTLGPNKFVVYPDEFRYYDIARNIYYGNWFVIHNIKVSYTKILYSLFLAPFFGISDVTTRLNLIALFNSLLLASSIIPLYLISVELKFSKKGQFLLLIFALLFSGNTLSIGIFQECLYYPLLLWLFYLWILNRRINKFYLPIIIGIVCYATYLCKEIAVIFILAMFFTDLIFPLFNNLINKKANENKEHLNKIKILNSTYGLISFMAVFILFRFTVFKNFNNSYESQIGIEALNSFTKVGYLFYSFLYFITGFAVSVLIFPIFYCFTNYKKLNKTLRELILLLTLFILILAITIAYTISIREDTFEVAPRLHLRYAYPCSLLFLLILIHLSENKSINFINDSSKKQMLIGGCLVLFAASFFKGSRYGFSGFDDAYTIIPINGIYMGILKIFNVPSNLNFIVIMAVNLFIFIPLFILFYPRKKHKNNKFVMSVLIINAAICFVSSVGYNFIIYTGNQNDITYIKNIDNSLSNIQNKNILCIVESTPEATDYDLYLDKIYKTSYITNSSILEQDFLKVGKDQVLVNQITLHETIWSMEYKKTDRIDYVLVKSNIKFNSIKLDTINLKEISNNQNYYFYENTSPYIIPLVK